MNQPVFTILHMCLEVTNANDLMMIPPLLLTIPIVYHIIDVAQ